MSSWRSVKVASWTHVLQDTCLTDTFLELNAWTRFSNTFLGDASWGHFFIRSLNTFHTHLSWMRFVRANSWTRCANMSATTKHSQRKTARDTTTQKPESCKHLQTSDESTTTNRMPLKNCGMILPQQFGNLGIGSRAAQDPWDGVCTPMKTNSWHRLGPKIWCWSFYLPYMALFQTPAWRNWK